MCHYGLSSRISQVSVYASAGDSVSKFFTTGVDGRLVIWTCKVLGALITLHASYSLPLSLVVFGVTDFRPQVLKQENNLRQNLKFSRFGFFCSANIDNIKGVAKWAELTSYDMQACAGLLCYST